MRTWISRLWSSSRVQKARRPRRLPLQVELLEDKLAPATITVTSFGDDTTVDGMVSLREAILSVNQGSNFNANVVATGTYGVNDTINFAIPGSGRVESLISLGSSLPTITRPVTINGYTQQNRVGLGGFIASPNTEPDSDNANILIQIDGTSAGTGVNGLTLGAGSGGSTIRGLDITNFQADASLNGGVGILVQSNGNTIAGNFVGVNVIGTTQMTNGGDGIRIVGASNNIIGGTDPADRNISSGNFLDGIHVEGTRATPSTGNVIEGNFVGVANDGASSVGVRPANAPTGAASAGSAAGNFLFGIEVSGGDSNTIGGVAAGARNVVGFNGAGIEVDNGGQFNVIQGNFSGVGADGVTPVKNLLHGIVLRSSNTFPAGSPLDNAQPNEPGVSFNLVGGTAAGAGNVVEFNGTGGIAVFGNPVSASGQPNVGNVIEGNSIFENGRSFATAASAPTPLLGIDLTNGAKFPTDDGLTPNDSKGHGAPNAPNDFQNFPLLTTAVEDGTGKTDITGTLAQSVSPNTTFRIEFFASVPDPLGLPAEGQQFLGSTSVTTDASGNASFSVALNVIAGGRAVSPGSLITATATDPLGNTSEFSAGLAVSTAPIVPPPPTPPTPPPTPATQPPPFVSVALTPFGEVLELVDAQGNLTQFSAFGAQRLGGGLRSASVAFGPFGEVLVTVTQTGILTQFDAAGAHTLGGNVLTANVTVGPFGEVLEVVNTNGALTQFSVFGAQTLATSGIVSASPAFNGNGFVLEVVNTNGVLTQFDATGAHPLLGGVISADVAFGPAGTPLAGAEVLDVIFSNGNLTQFSAAGIQVLTKLF